MATFTVVGEDGRRIERGVAESHARDLAIRLSRETGEHVTVLDDESGDELRVDGIDRSKPATKRSGGRSKGDEPDATDE